jgi:hypothetical protein
VKDTAQEIGFVIGGILGFALLVYENARSTRSSGAGNWFFVMLCGGVGWVIGWLVGLIF